MSTGCAVWFYFVGGIMYAVIAEAAFGSLWQRVLIAAAIGTTVLFVYEWLRTRAGGGK